MIKNLSRSADFSQSSILSKSYVCVYYGCSKHPSYVIDIISEDQLEFYVNTLGGNPSKELREKFEKKIGNDFESYIKTFNDLECPEDVNYKVFGIQNYDDFPHMCAEDYGEKIFCIQKGNHSIKQILEWVVAAQKF